MNLNYAHIKKIFQNIFIDISNYLQQNTSDIIIDKKNISGDYVKLVDLECEKIFLKHLSKNTLNIIGFVSEETEKLTFLKNIDIDESNPKYIVAFDPLDGSSNFAFNINTGSIYAIYEYCQLTHKLIKIVHSGYCLYGINTIMVYTELDNIIMSIKDRFNSFTRIRKLHFDDLEKSTKVYAINQANDYNTEMTMLLRYYKNNNYSMRWVGTLVADAHRILLSDGIFYYPTTDKTPNGKIRMLYESIPMAYIFKLAGGIGLNGAFRDVVSRIQDFNLENPHQKSGIILASKKEHHNLLEQLDYYESENCKP
uniref:Fructose-bisphosphatase n=1 Tax=viral metagenome TaxID=1070528 RepID=A0A6C0IVN8_9ZZZZ